MKKNILVTIIDVLIIGIFYYFILPPLNLTSPLFWFFMYLVVVIITISLFLKRNDQVFFGRYVQVKHLEKYKYIFISLVSILLIILLVNFVMSPIFNAKKFGSRITVLEDNEFINDVKQADFSKIPLIDRDSSQKLGDRKMGEFTSWVSQYYVSDLYTQINYNNEIVRVTPIEYADLIKYFVNHKEGVKGYIKVNSVDGKATLVNLDEGIRYLPSAYFFENLDRYLRIKYPTTIFEEASFEIDNDGNPYWIIPTVKYYGIGLRKEISGVVILNPITGESKKYSVNEVPSWVDHVYPADLIIEQIDNWGEYKNGFLNSILGQKEVVNTTEGYNYLVMDDDVYLYTGITSVSSDESNLGFVLVNLRTKETNYYSVPGAEEFSAMASAEGLVQEKKYTASFPLLINLNNKPTYLLSLKDDAGLVKMYAFIDVVDYQKVTVSDSSLGIEAASKKYLELDGEENTNKETKDNVITIGSINTAVVSGNTIYYITDTNNNLYYMKIDNALSILPFLKVNDEIKITYIEGNISQILNIGE